MNNPYLEGTYSKRIGSWCHIRELKIRLWLNTIQYWFIKWKKSRVERQIIDILSKEADKMSVNEVEK